MAQKHRIAPEVSSKSAARVGTGMEPESTPIDGCGLLTMPDAASELARRRAEVIAPLAGLSIMGKQASTKLPGSWVSPGGMCICSSNATAGAAVW